MPFFHLRLPDSALAGLKFATDIIVSAENVNDAKAIAKSAFDGDAAAAWDAATVTTLVETLSDDPDSMAGWKLRIAILDSTPVIDITATGVLGAVFATIGSGGTGYTVDDILTVSGGTFGRAATFKATSVSGGVVDGIELFDPGDYTALPGNPAATTGGTGTGATLNLTGDNDRMVNLVAHAVTLLNATSIISGSLVDFSATPPPVLIIAIGAGGDDLGDKDVTVEVIPPGLGASPIPGFLGVVIDKGVATDNLGVQITDPPTVTVPSVIATFNK